MKQKLFAILIVSISIFTSCEKSEKTDDPKRSEKHDVTFLVSEFSNDVKEMSDTGAKTSAFGDTLKNHADNLYYFVYNSSGSLINSTQQVSTLTTFGTINDKLPSGEYTVYLTACKGSLLHISESAVSTVAPFPKQISTTNNYWDDTFFKKISLTVGASAITQSVRLERIVGAVQVTLTDAIPANAAKITLVAQGDGGVFNYSQEKVTFTDTKMKEFVLSAADIGAKNKSFLMHIASTSTTALNRPVTLGIRAYDSQNGLISEKIVSDVFIYKNKRTVLSGGLFNTTTTSSLGMTFTVNPIWEPDIPVRTF